MPVEVREGHVGDYVQGDTAGNIDKLIELVTPSSEANKKFMAEPDFSLPDEEVCRLIRVELQAIKDNI